MPWLPCLARHRRSLPRHTARARPARPLNYDDLRCLPPSFSPSLCLPPLPAHHTHARYGFETELDQFRPDYNPNVIATLKGEVDPDTIIIVGAHYDSRQAARTSATLPAPGANDDGTLDLGLNLTLFPRVSQLPRRPTHAA